MSDNMRCSLAMSSLTHTYSIVTEYVRRWFLGKFNDGKYFKTIHLEESHVLDEFRKFDYKTILKKGKPALIILPKINLEYERDGYIDQNAYGLDYIITHSDLKQAFFRDYEKNLYIGTSFKEIELKYNFRIKVGTRAEQIDLYNYMKLAFRLGFREYITIDSDFHLPYSLAAQMAKDNNFEIDENGKIVKVVEFLDYFNSKSEFPITFKLRSINGKTEFFIRCKEVQILIDAFEGLSYDDGETNGMLMDNFNVEFSITLHTSAPRFFIYYSKTEHDISVLNPGATDNPDKLIYPSVNIVLDEVKKVNDRGWNLVINTEYYEENFSEGLSIDLNDLIKGTLLGELFEQIEYKLDPNAYCELQLMNGNDFKNIEIDWETNILTVIGEVNSPQSIIFMYIDLLYVQNAIIELEKLKENRSK